MLPVTASTTFIIRVIRVGVENIGVIWLDSADVVVGVDPTMNGGVDHDSTVDVHLDDLLSLLVISHTLMTLVIDALQGHKLLTTFDEVSTQLLLIFVVPQGIAVETSDLSSTLEGWDITIHGS